MKKICALTLVLCFVLALPISPIFALEEIESTSYNVETSDVMEDLSRTYIDGNKFDATEYPLNISADYMLLLNMIEYAWDEYSPGVDKSAYGLYFYLYNPSGDKPLTRGGHQIQMSVSKSDFYVKYLLKLVSASDDNRFLKFKLENADAVLDRLYSDVRTYKISGIEIETKAKGVKDYNIAGTYTFTGKQSSKTLSCQTDILTTIDLDLRSTYYRLDSSPKGKYYQSQLDSVYFALDNWLMQKYGEVYSIRFRYDKFLCNSLVTWDPIASNISKEVALGLNQVDSILPYGAVSYYGGYFSPYFGWRWDGLANTVPNKNFIMSAFFVDSSDYYISPEELFSYCEENDMYIKAIEYGLESRDFSFGFYEVSDEITIEDDLPLLSVYSNIHFLDQLIKYGLFDGSLWGNQGSIEMEPIYKVKAEDLDALNLSSELYISSYDVDEFKDFYNASIGIDQSVYLFRFATQDYYSMPMQFFDKSDLLTFPVYRPPVGGLVDGLEGNVVGDQTGAYHEQYLYKDFDIISLSFLDEHGILTVLPVVSTPTDVGGGLTPPDDGWKPSDGVNDDGDDDSWKKVLSIIMIVLVVILVIWLITKIKPQRVKVVSSKRRRR